MTPYVPKRKFDPEEGERHTTLIRARIPDTLEDKLSMLARLERAQAEQSRCWFLGAHPSRTDRPEGCWVRINRVYVAISDADPLPRADGRPAWGASGYRVVRAEKDKVDPDKTDAEWLAEHPTWSILVNVKELATGRSKSRYNAPYVITPEEKDYPL